MKNYDFDSNELSELEEKLHQRLLPRLQEIRKRAETEAANKTEAVKGKSES